VPLSAIKTAGFEIRAVSESEEDTPRAEAIWIEPSVLASHSSQRRIGKTSSLNGQLLGRNDSH